MRRLVAVLVLFLLCVPCAEAWTWPVTGPVLTPFTFDAAHPYAAGQHRGIDIGAPGDAAVVAPAAGTVTFAGTVPTSGKTVSLLTADSLSVTLTHLGALAVAKGALVAEGAAVGTVGPSGTPELDVPYVHFGVRTADNDQGYLDPLAFLPPLAPPAPPPAPAAVPAAPSELPAATTPAPEPAPAAAAAAPDAAPADVAPRAEATPAAPAERPPTQAPSPPETVAPETAPSVPAAPSIAPAPPADTQPVQPAEPSSLSAAPADFDPAAPTPAPLLVDDDEALPSVLPRLELATARSPVAAPAPLELAAVDPFRRAGVPDVRTARPSAPQVVGHVSLPRPTRTLPAAAFALGPPAAHAHHTLVALLAAAALAVVVLLVRMIRSPFPRTEGASAVREDPRRTGVAVWQRPAPHRPRGGLRRARGRVRALPPAEGRRRADGQRDGRARHARDGGGRSQRRVSA